MRWGVGKPCLIVLNTKQLCVRWGVGKPCLILLNTKHLCMPWGVGKPCLIVLNTKHLCMPWGVGKPCLILLNTKQLCMRWGVGKPCLTVLLRHEWSIRDWRVLVECYNSFLKAPPVFSCTKHATVADNRRTAFPFISNALFTQKTRLHSTNLPI